MKRIVTLLGMSVFLISATAYSNVKCQRDFLLTNDLPSGFSTKYGPFVWSPTKGAEFSGKSIQWEKVEFDHTTKVITVTGKVSGSDGVVIMTGTPAKRILRNLDFRKLDCQGITGGKINCQYEILGRNKKEC